MASGSQFRGADFYDPASPEFADQFDLIRRLGGTDSTMRSAEESEIALFWEDGPWGVTAPGHFVCVAIQLLQDRGLSFIELARAFALIGMTQCDASICAWDNKYHHDILRPESAIRIRAPDFGNPDPRVARVPGWRSFIPTPEFPSYTSGHSTFGAVAAEMIALICGRDDIAFSGRSPDQVVWPQLDGGHAVLDKPEPDGRRERDEPAVWRSPLGGGPQNRNECRPRDRAAGFSGDLPGQSLKTWSLG